MAFEELSASGRSPHMRCSSHLLVRLHPSTNKRHRRSFSMRMSSDVVSAMRLMAGDHVKVSCDPSNAWMVRRVPVGADGAIKLHVPNGKSKTLALRATIPQQQADRWFEIGTRQHCSPANYDDPSCVVFGVTDIEN